MVTSSDSDNDSVVHELTTGHYEDSEVSDPELLAGLTCPVQQLMSFIGLSTATEKQVYLGPLHMRPIQWHLKQNWRVPESLEKVIPVPRSLQSNVLQDQPLYLLKHAFVYRCIKRRALT